MFPSPDDFFIKCVKVCLENKCDYYIFSTKCIFRFIMKKHYNKINSTGLYIINILL